jgi:hypothetical protein
MEAAYKNMHEKEKCLGGLTLPKEFKWFKPGLGFTCKAKDIGLESFVNCLEIDSYMCPFSVFYGYSNYCSCPARVHAAKELEK